MSAWIIVWLCVLLGGGTGLRARSNRRLRYPSLRGIPLPAADDPRWCHDVDGRASLGLFAVVRQSADGLRDDRCVYFESRFVGLWYRYVEAVLCRLERSIADDRAARALAAICDEPLPPPSPSTGDGK